MRALLLSALLPLLACQPDLRQGEEPTFGGPLAAPAGHLPTPETTEAAWLKSAPLPVLDGRCDAPLCAGAAAAVLPDGRWLVAVGLEGALVPLDADKPDALAFERPPVDLVVAADLSGSMGGAEVVGASVEMALDRLRDGDTLAIVGFSDVAEVLLEPGPVGRHTAGRVQSVLTVTDRVPALRSALDQVVELLPEADACHDRPSSLAADLEACLAVPPGPMHPCGEAWAWTPPEAVYAVIDELDQWTAFAEAPATDDLAEALQPVACGGTDVVVGLEQAVALAPSGTASRASRVVLISDLDGAAEARPVVEAAAARFVGTTILGATGGVDRASGDALACAPGALFLDASDAGDALATWHARFDLLIAPRAWSLRVEGADEVFGATDVDGLGANAVFASQGHGALGAVIAPPPDTGATPVLRLVYQLPDGQHTVQVPVLAPVGLVRTPFAVADSVPALDLAARRHLYLHRDDPGGAVAELSSLLDHPLVPDEALPSLRRGFSP